MLKEMTPELRDKANQILEKAVRANSVSNYWYKEYEQSGNSTHLDYATQNFEIACAYLESWSILTDIEMLPTELVKFESVFDI